MRIVAVIALLCLAGAAGASVKPAHSPGIVEPGSKATLTVKVAPSSRCTITVVYATGRSEARGLGAKTGSQITWSWTVGSATKAGRWPVTVDCGKAGKLTTTVRVK